MLSAFAATEIEEDPICSKFETPARFGLAISSSGRPKPGQSHAFVQSDTGECFRTEMFAKA